MARSTGLFSSLDREVLHYGDLLRSLLRRDIALRYRQTLLGPVWILLQPLLGAGVFTFLFGSVAGVESAPGVPYFIFALVGLSLWTAFAQGLTRATSSILANGNLATKIYFPRLLLPLSAGGSAVVDCGVTLSLALVLNVVFGPAPTWRLLTVPFLALALLLVATLLGAGLSVLLVRFRDVSYGLPVLTQLLLFVTPVLYAAREVPDDASLAVDLNPLTAVFEALRWACFSTPPPTAGQVLYSTAVWAAVGLVSLLLFSRLERDIADVI